MRIINECTAACIGFGLNIDQSREETYVFVFDLGAGSLKMSTLIIEDGIFDVTGTFNDSQFGGRDFDNVLVEHCIGVY